MATINTVFSLTDNMSPSLNVINSSLNTTMVKMIGINQTIAIFNTLKNAIDGVFSKVNDLYGEYSEQIEKEQKLTTVMKQRMNASREDIEYIKNLASETERLGIYSDDMILNGAQELATFVEQKEAIGVLLPALANLVAQQSGYSASSDEVRDKATMMGRVITGNISGLSRLGYVFDGVQKHILETGTEMERATALAEIMMENVGSMNEALANTPTGQMMQLKNEVDNVKKAAGEISTPFVLFKARLKGALDIKIIETFMSAMQYTKTHVEELATAITALGIITMAVAAKMAIAWTIANWPIALAIAGVGLFISILASLGVKATTMSKIFFTVFEIIYALIYDIGVIAFNVITAVINELIGLYNFCTTLVESIVNLFISPLDAFKQLFIGIANFFLELIEPLFGIVDMIFGTDVVKNIKNSIESARQWASEDAVFKIEKKETIDYAKRYESEFNLGDKINDTISRAYNLSFNNPNLKPDFDFDNLKLPTSGNGSILVNDKDLLEIAEDYRDLLSKRAIEKFNLQFSQLTPSINIDNVVVNKEVDAQNVLDTVANAISEFSNSSLSTNSGAVGWV